MLKYFLPDWEDRVDPDFDFKKDCFSSGHKKNPYENDVYAHQIFDEPPYDGLLVSLAIFEKKLSLNQDGNEYLIRNKNNIKTYLKIPEESTLEVMGDCGAFGYVREEKPPEHFYTVKNIANIYESLGFDYGVSVDHLAVDYFFVKNPKTNKREKIILSKTEKDKRIQITLDNASSFLDLHNQMEYNFIPVGVAQGYNLDTYKNSFISLVEMGYDYIALGGLVQYPTSFILKILNKIKPYRKKTKIHLFGVLRKDYLDDFQKLGVYSFDSTSFFRKAWLRSGQNYLSTDNKWYASIRVPQANNPRILKNPKLNGFKEDDIALMERNALKALYDYDNKNANVEEVLDAVMKYDDLLLRNTNDGDNLRKKYLRTLLEKPWKKCQCPVCQSIGINALIFRGTNRNKRRGFHNLWAFRNMSKNLEDSLSTEKCKENYDKTLCIVSCGSKKVWDKNPKAGPTKAEEVYIGTFAKKCIDYAKTFYPDSWCILSAKHGFLFPEELVSVPYNVSFNLKDTNPITLDELYLQVPSKGLDKYEDVVVVAGKTYTNMLKKIFNQKQVYNPLDGCEGIGYMMGRLSSLINEVS